MWLVPRDPGAGDAPRSNRRVVALGGDGIGPEVVSAAVACIRATGAPVDIDEPVHGAASLEAGDSAFPDAARHAVEGADAILFGAVDTGPRGHCRAILRHLRFELDTYANIRPAAWIAGIPSLVPFRNPDARPNLVIVRELSEGLYPGCEGDLAELQRRWPELRDALGRPVAGQGAFALRVITEPAARRIARYAGQLAAHRARRGAGRGHVTVVTKSNVLRRSDGRFLAWCGEELGQLGVSWDELYVDEAARRLVACPEEFDVLVTSNLFGDILSDVASELMGGMPLAPSAGIGARHAYFESCHGSAPDIAGTGTANPSATILSAAMMLGYLGLGEHGRRLVEAVAETIADGCRTRDLGGTATTDEITDAVCRRVASSGQPAS